MFLAFGAYLVALYVVTLTPAGSPFEHMRRLNLVPFRMLGAGGTPPLARPLYQLLGNVFLLAPIGALLAVLPVAYPGIRRFRVWQVAVLAMVVSGGIETAQYVMATGRVADIDDVICNTCGMVATYWVLSYAVNLVRRLGVPRRDRPSGPGGG